MSIITRSSGFVNPLDPRPELAKRLRRQLSIVADLLAQAAAGPICDDYAAARLTLGLATVASDRAELLLHVAEEMP